MDEQKQSQVRVRVGNLEVVIIGSENFINAMRIYADRLVATSSTRLSIVQEIRFTFF
jgi:hypothetical protein